MRVSDIERMARTVLEQGKVESDCIEYKKSATFQDKILKTACAYANNYMNREIGLIFIGVEEVDSPEEEAKGVPRRPLSGIPEESVEPTENRIKHLLGEIHPKPAYHFVEGELDGRCYIVIAVEPGHAGPYETSARAERDRKIGLKAGRYIRVGRDSRLPNAREEFSLLKKFADVRFSSQLNETATLEHLSYEYMREYLRAVHASEDLIALSKEDMALAMGLVTPSDYGGLRARNFAVLMFADCPQHFIPYARIEIIREVGTTDRMTSKVFDGPVWIQVQRAVQYFEETILDSYVLRSGEMTGHRTVCNWPKAMFAELLTNCVLHKEYDADTYIGVYVYADRIVFVNHNRPLPPVTIEDLNVRDKFDERTYLNLELRDMLYALGLIESFGSGIRRAKRAMEENGSPALVFEPRNDFDEYTKVTALIHPEFLNVIEEGAQEPSATPIATPNATPIRLDEVALKIIDILSECPTASAKELGEKLGMTRDGARYHLGKLTERGIISHHGPSRGGHWEVHRHGH